MQVTSDGKVDGRTMSCQGLPAAAGYRPSRRCAQQAAMAGLERGLGDWPTAARWACLSMGTLCAPAPAMTVTCQLWCNRYTTPHLCLGCGLSNRSAEAYSMTALPDSLTLDSRKVHQILLGALCCHRDTELHADALQESVASAVPSDE